MTTERKTEKVSDVPAYADPQHPTNKIRPNLKCWGCGTKGVVGKHWGQWCFKCNVARIGHIDDRFSEIAKQYEVATHPAKEG